MGWPRCAVNPARGGVVAAATPVPALHARSAEDPRGAEATRGARRSVPPPHWGTLINATQVEQPVPAGQ